MQFAMPKVLGNPFLMGQLTEQNVRSFRRPDCERFKRASEVFQRGSRGHHLRCKRPVGDSGDSTARSHGFIEELAPQRTCNPPDEKRNPQRNTVIAVIDPTRQVTQRLTQRPVARCSQRTQSLGIGQSIDVGQHAIDLGKVQNAPRNRRQICRHPGSVVATGRGVDPVGTQSGLSASFKK